MKKVKLTLASLGIICLFLLIPSAIATTSNVWFDQNTEIIWKFTTEALDESMIVTDTNFTYRKLNFTEFVEGSDHINITGDVYEATENDIMTYGFTDPTIWEINFTLIDFSIEDANIITKFKSLINEQDIDIRTIEPLPSESQTLVLMNMVVLLDPSFFGAAFVYSLAHAFAATFGHDINGSTITNLQVRKIQYSVILDFSIDDSGHWNNISYNSDVDLTYGTDSNILLKGISVSNLVLSNWNGSAYVAKSFRMRYTHDIAYPDDLVNDYPPPKQGIPGYPVWILVSTIALSIVLILTVKRKKK